MCLKIKLIGTFLKSKAFLVFCGFIKQVFNKNKIKKMLDKEIQEISTSFVTCCKRIVFYYNKFLRKLLTHCRINFSTGFQQ
jgi:hypothetical protein